MSVESVRVRVERPPAPRYIPGRGYALRDPADPTVHCLADARLYACGWRCDPHSPRSIREKTSQPRKEAA